MKVKELIEELQKLDPEYRLFTHGYEGGLCDASININNPIEVALDVNKEDYYGPHEETDIKWRDFKGKELVKGYVL